MPKRVSVIIPTYNRKNTLKETLLSFVRQTSDDFEIIVADDGSGDGTGEMVRGLKPPFPLRHIWQENAGRSAARNMGIEQAEGEILLFIDDHIIVDKKLIEEHIKYHDRYSSPQVAVIRGRVSFADSISDVPGSFEYIPEERIKVPADEQDPFRHFITNNISIKKAALLDVGGFDEDFREYGLQDSELGFRLKKAGYRFKIDPNALGCIFGVGLSFEDRLKRRRQVGRSSVLFYKKHPTLRIKLTLSTHWLSRLIFRVLSIFRVLLRRKPTLFYSFLEGLEDGFNKYGKIKRMPFRSRLKRTKVLFVSHNLRLEGAPISLYLIAKNLDRTKFNPIFSAPDPGPLCDMLDKSGLPVKIFGSLPGLSSYRLRKLIKENEIDIVHVNTLALYWAIGPARSAGAKVVWHVREDPKYFKHTPVKKYIYISDKVIAISDWVRRSLPQAEKIVVVHNAVDPSSIPLKLNTNGVRNELNVSAGELLVGQVGALSDRKGTDIFLKAASEVIKERNDVKFLLVGDYTPGEFYRSTVQKLVDQLNLGGKIIFAGIRSDIYDVISAMDVVASSSRSEPFGRTIIEAMILGKPVVAAKVGGIPEIIIDGQTGLLVGPEDPASLAGCLLKLLRDSSLRDRIGGGARKRAESVFSIHNQIERIEKIYTEVASEAVGDNAGLQ